MRSGRNLQAVPARDEEDRGQRAAPLVSVQICTALAIKSHRGTLQLFLLLAKANAIWRESGKRRQRVPLSSRLGLPRSLL